MANGIYGSVLFLIAGVTLSIQAAQNPPNTKRLTVLEVSVKDTAGAFIIGAVIMLKNLEQNSVQIFQIGAIGSIRINDLQPSAYELRIEAHGYKPTIFKELQLSEKYGSGYTVFLKGDGVINPVDLYKEEPVNPANRKFSVGGLKKEVKKYLPLGSTPSQVSDFMKLRGIDPGELRVSKGDSDYPDDENLKLISAMIWKVKKGLFGYWSIRMTFRFDEEDRLIDYKINWVDKT